MFCNCVIKNYLSNTSKGWILRAKPIQYKINPKELGVIFADKKINFQNEESAFKYITSRLVDALNRPHSEQFERVIAKRGLTILGEGDGESRDCANALWNIIDPLVIVERMCKDVPRDLEVFHSHPDILNYGETGPLSSPINGDIATFFKIKLKKIVAINSKGEFNSMEVSDNFSEKKFRKFQKDFIKFEDLKLHNGLMSKYNRIAAMYYRLRSISKDSKLTQWLSKKCNECSQKIKDNSKKYKNADVFKVKHEFYQKADLYGMKYSTNFSNLINKSGS